MRRNTWYRYSTFFSKIEDAEFGIFRIHFKSNIYLMIAEYKTYFHGLEYE